MRDVYQAIIHLREPAAVDIQPVLASVCRLLRGISEVDYNAADSLITVQFDSGETGLAEIVRFIEDGGASVSGVAQRRIALRESC